MFSQGLRSSEVMEVRSGSGRSAPPHRFRVLLRGIPARLPSKLPVPCIVCPTAFSTAVNTGPSDTWVPEIPAGRYGTSQEMAAAVVYLSSDEARYITGQQIVLDGGVSVRGPFPE